MCFAHNVKIHNNLVNLQKDAFLADNEDNTGSMYRTYSCDVGPEHDDPNIRLVFEQFRDHHQDDPTLPDPPPEPPPDQDGEDLTSDKVTVTPPIIRKPKERDWQALRPLFGWMTVPTIKKTFDKTTQWARTPNSEILKQHFRSPFPWANVVRRNEALATDTVFADVPAIDGGETCAQFFEGTTSKVVDIIGMKTEKQFVNTLEDVIRYRGAPNMLISDHAQVEISSRVKDILRALFISDWQSEAYHQHQNPAENRYNTVKTWTNVVLERSGAPPELWLEALKYICFLLNHTYCNAIDGIPLEKLLGHTVDISILLRFYFYQEVYFKQYETDFPSDSKEEIGYVVGFAEHVGHKLTYRVLTKDTRKILSRSTLRPVDPNAPNKRLDLLSGEDLDTPKNSVVKSIAEKDMELITLENGEPTKTKQVQTIKTKGLETINEGEEEEEEENNLDTDNSKKRVRKMPVFKPADLVGRTYLMEPRDDGQKYRARIVEAIEGFDDDLGRNPTRVKFKVSVNNEDFEELVAYNDVVESITKDDTSEVIWRFKRITSHQGPLKPDHPDYNGSTYNVLLEWETGEITKEPLNMVAKDDPVTCAIYAAEHDLLDKPGWIRFRKIARRQKKLLRMTNQAKLRSYNTAPKYMFGYQVPRNYADAQRLDRQNGNEKWQEAVRTEMKQLAEYDTFQSLGRAETTRIPAEHKKIRVHLVFAVKHDGRHKARLVADGHLTDVPMESVYSGVVSLRGFRLVVFLAELNNLEIWATDIGNAYLEAKTKEKLVIVAGPEFGELAGHLLVIRKALYGLRTSGLRWHERFSECLQQEGFKPCIAEPDIWMRPNGDVYEYIAVYVDDLAMAMKDPAAFVKILTEKHGFKLKGTGEISYHLGMDFSRGPDGTLQFSQQKYIDKMLETYTRMFGEAPSGTCKAPIEPNDHPELDTSEFLDEEGTSKYQSLIGTLQWIITIGRFDVQTAVMTLSSFRAAPRMGHLERTKRIYKYIKNMRYATIRFRTTLPDYSTLPEQKYDWSSTVYGDAKEMLPHNAPPPLGNPVITTSFKDANLMHDMLTGKSVTGILHFVNKTPIDWYCKKQSTVETATYGSEFSSGRTCVEQIIDLRNTLRYLGVPVWNHSYMFGDNKSVVDSATLPHSKLNKRHTILSFHRVREAIASGMIKFYHIPGETNPSDILSKHWAYSSIWSLLKPLLFYREDAEVLLSNHPSMEVFR